MRTPNLNTLRMFDAAARHLNFRLAAEELNLTQGAVAQQVRRLEQDLDQPLFHRHARGLTLTDAGRSYHQPVSKALKMIADATQALAPSMSRVTISVPPSFATKWLVPRLPAFQLALPLIDLRILAEEGLADVSRDGTDIAVRLGKTPKTRGLHAAFLADEDLCVVAAPDIAAKLGDTPTLEMLVQRPLIQDGHRHWDRRIKAQGLDAAARVLQFNQTALAMDAAANGQGLALVPRIFLPSANLQTIAAALDPSDNGFHVLWTDTRTSVQSVVLWLRDQFA